MGRPKAAKAATDNDITDEAAGKARIAAATASKARKEAEANALNSQNTNHKAKLNKVAARSDDDIMDEEAGRARLKLAAQSKARKAREAANLAAANRAMAAQRAAAGAKADDDIMDEEAGRARTRLADESKARRAADAVRIARENREYRERLKSTKARTDDDLMDDDQPGGRVQAKMTAAAVYGQYRKPPPKPDPDARDGHITDYERKMASRGEDINDFPWSTWSTPDWQTWKNGSTLQPVLQRPMPQPSPATHTKRWLKYYDSFNSRRGQQLSLNQTQTGGVSPTSP